MEGGYNMNVVIKSNILADLKNELTNMAKDVVRFEIVDFGWSGPIFDIVLDEQKENDVITNLDGVKFAADNEIASLINNPEIIKVDMRVSPTFGPGQFSISENGLWFNINENGATGEIDANIYPKKLIAIITAIALAMQQPVSR